MSVVDILVALYCSVMRITPATMHAAERDRVLLSKGHAVAALHFVLHEAGLIPDDPLTEIGRRGDTRAGHPVDTVPGVEVSSGALGHGLSVGTGMALAAGIDRRSSRVVVVLGDGELNEGAVWEAAMFAGHARLEGLTAVVDRNRMQQSGRTQDILDLEPLSDKWTAFGWQVTTVDGHDLGELCRALEAAVEGGAGPRVVLANTVKGKGVDFMEDALKWHQAQLDETTLARALDSLGVVS